VRCPICDGIYGELRTHVKHKHGYSSFEQFRKDYPGNGGGSLVGPPNHRGDNIVTAHKSPRTLALHKLRPK
jgi:hypothetical protein